MNKLLIKDKLRESLMSRIKEGEPKKDKETSKKGKESHNDNKYDKDYAEVQRKLDGTLLKASQVMAASGLGNPDDATARSLFSKKVRKETNDEGGQYLFDDKELASVIKVINNPSAYLNVKK